MKIKKKKHQKNTRNLYELIRNYYGTHIESPETPYLNQSNRMGNLDYSTDP